MTLLLKLHDIAAQRGDGLRPELLEAMRREARASAFAELGPVPISVVMTPADIAPAGQPTASSEAHDGDPSARDSEPSMPPHPPASADLC